MDSCAAMLVLCDRTHSLISPIGCAESSIFAFIFIQYGGLMVSNGIRRRTSMVKRKIVHLFSSPVPLSLVVIRIVYLFRY